MATTKLNLWSTKFIWMCNSSLYF